MAMEFGKAMFPRVDLNKWDDLTAVEVGRVVGAKQAALSEMETREMTEKEAEALERLLTKQWGDKAEEKFLEQIAFAEEQWVPAYKRAVTRVFTSARKQTPREQADFFKGYADTVWEMPDARSTTTTKIYMFMVLYWREFEALAKSGRFSVRHLHDLLCKLFGSHLVGDRKNIEKMCERKGLHFRGRGRPGLPEKSDTKAG
jgi:hypothetical protein